MSTNSKILGRGVKIILMDFIKILAKSMHIIV